jgi:hypothetical protein
MRALVLLAVLGLAGCVGNPARTGEPPQQLSRAIDHDIETSLPSADRNLRAVPPSLPPPIENGAGTPRF